MDRQIPDYPLIFDKADRALRAARRNLDAGDYDFASSRAYYACFYALKAVLLSKGITVSRHGGAISEFNRYFVKEGTFPKEFGKLITQLFDDRQTGDYSFTLEITEPEAEADIDAAQRITDAARLYLVGKDLLP